MGISFKISKRGSKYNPKPVISESTLSIEDGQLDLQPSTLPPNGKDEDAVGHSGSSLSSGRHHISADEVSFILNLYLSGYSIGKPTENDSGIGFQEGSKILHPYDRTSEGLFTAIESGRLPGSILDNIPCKYVEGALTCEVRDYRKCMSDPKSNISLSNGAATINKVRLKMSLENVVKDIPLMTNDSWTYGDLMEVESRILKALEPKLCLDPIPKLDRLCENPVALKLDLGLRALRKRRLRQIPEVTVTSSNRPHGKKICIDRAPESSSYRIGELGPTSGDVMSQHVQDNVPSQGLGNHRHLHDPVLNATGALSASQDMPISYADNMNSTILEKMEGQEPQLSPHSNLSKRQRVGAGGPDGVQHPQIGSFMDGLQPSDVQWRNTLMQQQQPNSRGFQYNNSVLQRYPQLVGDGITNHSVVKLEKTDPSVVKTDMQMMEAEGNHMDPRLQQRFQQQLRTGIQHAGWSNLSLQVEKEFRKEEHFQKRKSIQSPRVSSGATAQSPLTGKPPEVSGGSMGTPYAVSSAATLGHLPREKSAVSSIPAVGRSTSITSSAYDSMQAQHHAQLAAKRRSNSLPKTPVISGVGSPVSVNNMGGPINASSPSVSTPQLSEPNMLERFAKIEMFAMRHQLNHKKNKVDDYPRRPRVFSSREVHNCLLDASNYDFAKDETSTSLSKSLVGGSKNVRKIRIVNVQPQANMHHDHVRTRLILSEKPNNGTVAIHYGELEVTDCLNAEDHLPALPNVHLADLLAVQFCNLMNCEGYFTDDQVQPRPPCNNIPSNNQPNAPAVTPNNSVIDMHPYPESGSKQQTAIETKPNISSSSMNLTPNILPNSGMLPPGNSQALQMSQAHLSGSTMPPRQQQMDQQQLQQALQQQQQPLQQQQQPQQLPLHSQPSLSPQQAQFQRSSLMLPTNSMPQLNTFGKGANLPLSNQMGNKLSPLHILQQQQQPQAQVQVQAQAQAQLQRRMMLGLGPTMGMGNIGNIGIGGLG